MPFETICFRSRGGLVQNDNRSFMQRVFDLPKRFPNASAALARFCIDFDSPFGTFFVPLGVVFCTRFVQLKPAPRSNHGS